jgi:pimeloyl-ACP methyl ester carboxylesterase
LRKFRLLCVAVISAACSMAALAQQLPVPYPTPADPGSDKYTTTYVRLGPNTEGLLLQPVNPGPNSNIAMVFSHPNSDNFGERPGWYMVRRGYPVMLVNYRGNTTADDLYLPSISLGISYMKHAPGIRKVVLLAHSGGTHLGALYQNVAENGPSACQGSEKIYPCNSKGLEKLERADGLILLDPTLGAAHQATAVDPAVTNSARNRDLDMFAEANGFNPNGKANYSPEFVKRFYKAQSVRNNKLIDDELQRLKVIEQGKGEFTNDEPLLIRGIGVTALGARLYQPDPDFQGHTKVPHLLLRADGTESEAIIKSVRDPVTGHPRSLNALGSMNDNTTVREFLANMAVRTTGDYAMTADDIVGIDWASSYTSTPSNVEGVTVPSLVLTMGCHYLIVPGEVIYNHMAAKDKFYATVEGATHGFYPCRQEYGDTVARVFDFVDRWTSKPGRF